MYSNLFRTGAICLTVTAIAMVGCVAAQGKPEPLESSFSIREPLGQNWNHELVSFELPRAITSEERDAYTLTGPDGELKTFQFHLENGVPKVAFQATVPAYGQVMYHLTPEPSAPASSSFAIERTDRFIRVSNGVIGIEVPTPAGAFSRGPIQAIRLKSGQWIGVSRLDKVPEIENYQVEIAASGPVFIDIVSRYRFADGADWTLRMRLIAGEPVILVREQFDIAPDASWYFVFNEAWTPNRVIMRPGTGPGPYDTRPIAFDDSVAATVGPWIQWWDAKQGLVCGLFNDKQAKETDDLLIVAAGNVAAWARSEPGAYDNAPQRYLRVRGNQDGSVTMQLPLIGPGRSWMLAAGSLDETQHGAKETAPFHKLMNRYMETPLEEVKNMPLQWQRSSARYPRLAIAREDLIELLESSSVDELLADSKDESAGIKRVLWPLILGETEAVNASQIDAVKQQIRTKLDDILDVFRYGNRGYPAAMYGTLIPRVDTVQLLPHLDLALGAGIFTDAELDRIFSQLALIALKLHSPDYVSPGRSLAGNPNMVTAWSTSLVLFAALMPDHPHASQWYREGMSRLDNMLETWQGPNGGWLEAPHYQVAALDPIFLAKRAAFNAGLSDSAHNERLLRTTLFLAKLSTPPDPRFGEVRHYPPLGNTYLMETSMFFGAMATQIADREPDIAAALQWTWQQHGQPRWAGLGGVSYMNFYTHELLTPDWTPPAPQWKSELFPGFGAVLRTGFPGDRETYMVYHQGDVATAHYDQDQGSFEFWGKGRPLSLDWGYRGHMAAWLHNRMSPGNVGKINEFTTLQTVDYVRGRQGSWDRQILFVKDKDPLGPTYVIMRDMTGDETTEDWWLWLNHRKKKPLPDIPENGIFSQDLKHSELPASVALANNHVHMTGEHDVDLDVWLGPETEEKLKTLRFRRAAVATVTGYVGGGWSAWNEGRTDQVGLHMPCAPKQPLVSILYPRLATAPSPAVDIMAGGNVVKISGKWGVDYVFLAPEKFEFEDGPVRFEGTAGVIQRRGDQVTLTLSAAGSIADGTAELAADAPRTQTF